MNGWGWSQYNWPPTPTPTGQGTEPGFEALWEREQRRRAFSGAQFWETLPGQWGSPETFLPQPLWDVMSQYPIRPDWLPQMMGIPYKRENYPGHEAAYDRANNMLYLPEDISPRVAFHEYAHAMQPPGWEDAYRRLAWAAPWDLPGWIDWGDPAREAYAEMPQEPYRRGRPMPDYLRQYYPWINW